MGKIQMLLFDKFTDFFENKLDNENKYIIFDNYRFGMFLIIVHNEFRNRQYNFIKRL